MSVKLNTLNLKSNSEKETLIEFRILKFRKNLQSNDLESQSYDGQRT